MSTTNVMPESLNYNTYSGAQYDRDIVHAIPFYQELHEAIERWVTQTYPRHASLRILDLGVGTGITSALLQTILPNASFVVVDFAEHMLQSAKERLGDENVEYYCADYASMDLEKGAFDIIISVIGLHHQNTAGKKEMLKKIYTALKPGGRFLLGDLVTHKQKEEAAVNHAKHFHHLVEHAADEKTLQEWAYHHLYLNDLAPKENLYDWIRDCGFDMSILLQEINTCLLVAQKPHTEKTYIDKLFSDQIQEYSVQTNVLGRVTYTNFDNAATTPPFSSVEDAVNTFMKQYGSVHRGAGTKSQLSTDLYEESRLIIRQFVNAPDDTYVIFSNNTTGGMNMLAHFFSFLPGQIAVSAIEHSSSWLPWITSEGIRQLGPMRSKSTGQSLADTIQVQGRECVLTYDTNKELEFDLHSIENVLAEHTIKALVLTASSNVTGYCPDIKSIGALCKKYNTLLVVDACQYLPHQRIDMEELGIDFLVASGHKLYAPYGAGFVIGSKTFFDKFLPYQIGGGNIDFIDKNGTFSFTRSNLLHDPGTPNAVGAVAIATALTTLSHIGFHNIHNHEYTISKKIYDSLTSNEQLDVYTKAEHLHSIITFTVRGQSAEETARILNDDYGIGVRAGNFCVYRVIQELTGKNDGVVRISVGLGNSIKDADRLISAIADMTK